MKLIADRQLRGSYGRVVPGQSFDAPEEIGADLVKRQLAHRAEAPRVTYETKVVVPEAPEVSARQPFRHGTVPHEESSPVAPEGDRVFSATDLPPIRTDDPGRRGGRAGSGAKR